jgi:hypothetical protein
MTGLLPLRIHLWDKIDTVNLAVLFEKGASDEVIDQLIGNPFDKEAVALAVCPIEELAVLVFF